MEVALPILWSATSGDNCRGSYGAISVIACVSLCLGSQAFRLFTKCVHLSVLEVRSIILPKNTFMCPCKRANVIAFDFLCVCPCVCKTKEKSHR